ncbi:DUF4388 domain-containing protein [Desulfonema magnum]|uniref:Cyclic nucleotide-binding domain-containing protein n=1 Tax=Desulfonema magnum TaxID=45655 RepID=A0A975BNI4_9BACT|nr:DUF4388 domain-containing protein [Desulfonema magnum]QTA88458.1 Cyclic nucleotide-binding domain-containing protein [Desulfonema magnum]
MSSFEAIIEIIGSDSCPLYRVGDEFDLSGKALLSPYNKPTCLILAGDIMAVLIKSETMGSDVKNIFDCSGCTGSARLEYKRKKEFTVPAVTAKHDNYIGTIVNLLSSFSVFKNLNENEIRDIVSFLRLDRFAKGKIILKRGEPGKKLFIIIDGKVEVLGEGGVRIATLGKGEIFGEMSLLSGDPVTATVKAVASAKVLYLNGAYFRKILKRFPPLQIHLARLLARRLAKTNAIRAEDFVSGMVGRLSEMPPSGLFQALNLNQKTGILLLELSKGPADLYFRDGEIIYAKYNEKKDREAFFELLKENEGQFRFVPGLPKKRMNAPILGDFMGLLMEGITRIDESEIV